MFKTTGKLNKEFFNNIKAFITPPAQKYLSIFMVAIACLFSAFTFYFQHYQYTVLFILFIPLIILEFYLLRNKAIKVNLKRMVETTGKDEYEYTVFFEDDGVVVENHSTGATAKIAFDKFIKLGKCDCSYVLLTKTHQIIPIFIDCLSDCEKEELLSFLKTHIPKLK